MRVLLLSPEYPPNVVGGGGAVFERIANSLAQAGHDVTVMFGDFTNKNVVARISRRRLSSGVEIIGVPLLPSPVKAAWLLSTLPPTPLALWDMFRLIRTGSWHVAHLHGVGFPLIDLGAYALRKARIPYVFTVHGVPNSPLHRGAVWASLLKAYLSAATRRTANGACQVTGVSRAVLEDATFPNASGVVIHNGIDTRAQWSPSAPRDAVPLRLVSASRLSRNKGLDVALRAIALLAERGVDVRYDLYGPDGGEQECLEALCDTLNIRSRVSFKGQFETAQRDSVLAAYDALLMPSRVEAFGLAALEGLALGLPVVASSVDGLTEFLDHTNSLLVPPDDPQALAHAISRLRAPQVRQSLQEQGLRTAAAFTWDEAVRRYESVLLGCAKVTA